jgi:hypothetical protein
LAWRPGVVTFEAAQAPRVTARAAPIAEPPPAFPAGGEAVVIIAFAAKVAGPPVAHRQLLAPPNEWNSPGRPATACGQGPAAPEPANRASHHPTPRPCPVKEKGPTWQPHPSGNRSAFGGRRHRTAHVQVSTLSSRPRRA